MPSRADLDAAAPAQRVVLWRYDGHLAVVNSRALEEVGITEDTPDPPGGIIDRDETGQPTGILRDQAINVVNAAIPPPAEEDIVAAMRKGFPVLHRLGLTGVHDMGLVEGAPLFRPWQLLRAAGELPLRAWVAIPAECLDEAVALGLRTGFGDEYLAVGPLKLFADGSQGARTAWMLEPYKDDGLGLPTTPPEELADAIRRADEAGISVAVHAIGDRANREVLNIFQRLKSSGRARATAPPANPHRIEHVQNIRLEDLSRLAQLGIVASVQPVHLVDDLPVVEQSVGVTSTLYLCLSRHVGHRCENGLRLRLSRSRPQSLVGHPRRGHPAATRWQPAGRLVPRAAADGRRGGLGLYHGTGPGCWQAG